MSTWISLPHTYDTGAGTREVVGHLLSGLAIAQSGND
jgi:hypothetical protein